MHTGGTGYVVGNVGTISGGTGDATYLVTAVGGFGTVTITTPTKKHAARSSPLIHAPSGRHDIAVAAQVATRAEDRVRVLKMKAETRE